MAFLRHEQREIPRTLEKARISPMTITSARPRSATYGAFRSFGGAWRRRGDIYLGTYAGWYAVRDEAFYTRERTHGSSRRRETRSHGRGGRMGGGAELFLSPEQVTRSRFWSITRNIPNSFSPIARRKRG